MTTEQVSANFWERVEQTDTCWLWTGHITSKGYPRLGPRVAYRVSWAVAGRELPPLPLQLDHLCKVRRCVNPDHLEAVTPAENNRRSMSPTAINARKTHCVHGHSLADAYHYRTGRQCRTCRHIAWARMVAHG